MKYWRDGFRDSNIHGNPEDSDIVLTDEEYSDLLSEQSAGKVISVVDGALVCVEPVQSFTKDELCLSIDALAGSVAESFAPYSLADQEYKLTQAQVAEWRSNGSPANDVPSALQSWVDASGLSVEDAAASIEASADSLNYALLEIRRIRLKAKRDIMDAETIEAAVNIRDTALTELESLK